MRRIRPRSPSARKKAGGELDRLRYGAVPFFCVGTRHWSFPVPQSTSLLVGRTLPAPAQGVACRVNACTCISTSVSLFVCTSAYVCSACAFTLPRLYIHVCVCTCPHPPLSADSPHFATEIPLSLSEDGEFSCLVETTGSLVVLSRPLSRPVCLALDICRSFLLHTSLFLSVREIHGAMRSWQVSVPLQRLPRVFSSRLNSRQKFPLLCPVHSFLFR